MSHLVPPLIVRRRPIIGISQRVVLDGRTGERRDALDQNWSRVAERLKCDLWPIPNHPEQVSVWLAENPPDVVILSGGNDIGISFIPHPSVGRRLALPESGDAPERDQTESLLLQWCTERHVPLIGVCRGMQAVNLFWGGRLVAFDRAVHVAHRHPLRLEAGAARFGLTPRESVNSYHAFGLRNEDMGHDLFSLAQYDTAVEACAHSHLPQMGIMWHPEREAPLSAEDLELFRHHFCLERTLTP